MEYRIPTRIVRESGVENASALLTSKPLQIGLYEKNLTRLTCGGHILLDFGKELSGGARILTHGKTGAGKVRLRFGESVTETCAELGEKNATNDHSPRDIEVTLAAYSDLTFGQTGFRFLRVDLLSEGALTIKSILAADDTDTREEIGYFECDDPLVNEIWKTASYTLRLCLQNGYYWDGVKRDRLVWIGDLYPEMRAAHCLFGSIPETDNSLTFAREETPIGTWMGFFPNYSIWWLIILADEYALSGNRENLDRHLPYVKELLACLNTFVDENGETNLSPEFIDWPTYYKEGGEEIKREESHAGGYYLLRIALEKCEGLLASVGEELSVVREMKRKLSARSVRVKKFKQIAALGILAGDESEENERILLEGGGKGLSTFTSYLVLTAMAKRGQYALALESMKEYYGGMLSVGATTFWEDFDLAWLENSSRLDEFPKEGQQDIHGDFGSFCYQGFRHSFCHGWSAGVLAYLMETVAGICFDSRGQVRVEPHLSGLKWVRAAFPTAAGIIRVSHRVDERGETHTEVER